MFAKKNLVAAAALLAVAGAAQADVKLYGYVEMAVGSYEFAHDKNDPDKVGFRTTKVQSGDMMTSFLGFSGSEDLGGGLKAEFTLETFLAADTGSTLANNHGGFWGRGSNVALSGGFGKIALGQYDNPLFTSGYTYNPFGSSMTFSPTMRHLSYIGQTGGTGVGFDTGWINSVTYESPVVGGFQGIAQYAPKETTVAGTKNSYALAGSYNVGSFSAMLTYDYAGKAPSTAWTSEQKVWNLGTSYDFGVVKAFLQYTNINEKDSTAVAVSSTVTNAAVDASTTKIYQVGVTVPVTDKSNVLLSYGESKFKEKVSGDKYKDRILSLGYDYALSKRTSVYGVFMNNDATLLDSGQTYAVGIKHNF